MDYRPTGYYNIYGWYYRSQENKYFDEIPELLEYELAIAKVHKIDRSRYPIDFLINENLKYEIEPNTGLPILEIDPTWQSI